MIYFRLLSRCHRSRKAAAAWLTIAALWLGSDLTAQPAATDRPNILFIYADDHAAHAISAYGSKINQTPQLDRLAAGGMIFRNSFVTNSICTPGRATILTGKYSHANGTFNIGDWFDGSQPTFPKQLQQAGYQTAVIGKWHLYSPPTGFDYSNVLIDQGPYYNPPMLENRRPVAYTGYTTDLITDRALEWLADGRDPDRPFMLMYQHKAPHREWAPGPDHLELYEDQTIPEPATLFDDHSGMGTAAKLSDMSIARSMTPWDLKLIAPNYLTYRQAKLWEQYYAPRNEALQRANLHGRELVRWKYQRYIKDYLRSVASIDDNLGRVLDYLEETGLADNTVVIYTSDQGFFLGEHGWFDKRFMYEESLRTPLIVRWPGVVSAGSENHDIVTNLDIAPTLLAMAEAGPLHDAQGRSLVPLLRGQTPGDWRSAMYYHYYEFPEFHKAAAHYGIRDDRYKLIHFYDLYEWELYDLQRDPHETNSVFRDPAYRPVVDRLRRQMWELQQGFGDTTPDAPLPEIRQRWAAQRAGVIEPELVLQLPVRGDTMLPRLEPFAKPLTVGARCRLTGPDGVLVAHGGYGQGYSLYVKDGRPRFAVRSETRLLEVRGVEPLPTDTPVLLTGGITPDGRLELCVDGRLIAEGPGHFLAQQPDDPLTVGDDLASPVVDYGRPTAFPGSWEDLRIYWGQPDETQLRAWRGGRLDNNNQESL